MQTEKIRRYVIAFWMVVVGLWSSVAWADGAAAGTVCAVPDALVGLKDLSKIKNSDDHTSPDAIAIKYEKAIGKHKVGDIDFTKSGNCAFHRWAWNKFLWLVQPDPAKADGSLRFENMSLTVGSSGFKIRDIKDDGQEGFQQDDPGRSILVDQADQPVYYAKHINAEFQQALRSITLEDLKKDPKTLFDNPPAVGKQGPWK